MMRRLTLLFCLMLPALTTQAHTLPANFDANFAVYVLGFNIGTIKQQMRCHQQDCTLTNDASPPDWAKRFINESSFETIRLQLDGQNLTWLSYHKALTRRYDNETKQIDTHLIAQADQVVYPEKALTWPKPAHLFDMVSLAYALQFYAQQSSTLPAFVLQDDQRQQALNFTTQAKPSQTHLNYKSDMNARLYEWNTDDFEVKVWLIEELNLFPGRIEVLNKREDRRIRLSLEQPPRYNEQN
jgi:hypothetical protein